MSTRAGVILIAFALLAANAPSRAQTASTPALAPGTAAPRASLFVNGRAAPLNAVLAGNRNLVLFYPAACGGACDSALQTIELDLIRTLDRMGVAVFAVSPDAPADQAKTIARLTLPYAVFSDPQGAAAQAFHVAGAPQAFLIDNDGTVRAIFGPGQTPLSASGITAAARSLKRRKR